MPKSRSLFLACALAPLAIVASRTASAQTPPSFLPTGEPLVWLDNCARDFLHPQEMRCLSRRLVPKSYADAVTVLRTTRRFRPLTPPPDAGKGVDASADIGTCDGEVSGGGGGTASGWAPADYVKAYDIPTSPTGAGKVVAIVDACAETTVVADLAEYRKNYGLPAIAECDGAAGHAPVPGAATPCLGVVSQRGGADLPPADSGWAGEIALDVEMVSAACPDCSILLVEADTPNSWDLGPAVNEAVALGASAVSNSYGAPEDPKDPFGTAYSDGPYAADYDHPGVLIAVASGDDLYNNQALASQDGNVLAPSFPSTVPTVLSVGGTSLASGSGTARGGFTETIWDYFGFDGTTSGCSGEFAKPAYQDAVGMGSCAMRGDVDVSASAEDVSTYVSGAWSPEDGTSCASPFVAALMVRLGLANQANAFFYAHGAAFYDVTSGNNDPSGKCTDVMCNAGAGWDGPTGWGTPNSAALEAILEADAGSSVDAGKESDAGREADAGADAGKEVDAGKEADAGLDAGKEADAGKPVDAGHGTDSGTEHDSGESGLDAGYEHDATLPDDASLGGGDDAATDDGGAVDDAMPSEDTGPASPGSSGGSGSSSGGGVSASSSGSSSGGETLADSSAGDEEEPRTPFYPPGCACTTTGSPTPSGMPGALGLFALGFVAMRRRRKR